MKIRIPPNLVKSSLKGHSWIGLLLGVLMYLICLSGALVVFYEEVERWEQPVAEEYQEFDTTRIEASFNQYLQSTMEKDVLTEHMYIVFPSQAVPRIKFSSDEEGFYVNQDGSLGEKALDDWSHLLAGLHINLHLPVSLGIIIVSAIGVLFLGLIISGFLAHPTIFKDAFAWRRDRSNRIAEVDLHNRLSVWGAPFHIMIALTGAYFGVAGLLITVAAQAFHGGDREAVTAKFFAPEPSLEMQTLNANIQRPLAHISNEVPDGKLLFMVMHDADTENRFQEYFVQYPSRLIYSDNFRFDMEGNFIDRAGYSDGSTAAQVVYSIYRLHFGHFAGIGTKLLYFGLGLALTVVSVTGINIWLIKRKKQDMINRLWAAIVWGTPASILITGVTQVLLQIPSTLIFWAGLAVAIIYSMQLKQAHQVKQHMKLACLISAAGLLIGYGAKYGSLLWSPAAIAINLSIFAFAIFGGWSAFQSKPSIPAETPQAE